MTRGNAPVERPFPEHVNSVDAIRPKKSSSADDYWHSGRPTELLLHQSVMLGGVGWGWAAMPRGRPE